jgi:hypothetical protein
MGGKEASVKARLMMGLAAGALVAAMVPSVALAGEVKGPPTGGDPNDNENTAALTHANSICVFSGLNDYQQGQTDKQTQTPADGPPGAPGLGFYEEGFLIDCRGGSNPDRGGES